VRKGSDPSRQPDRLGYGTVSDLLPGFIGADTRPGSPGPRLSGGLAVGRRSADPPLGATESRPLARASAAWWTGPPSGLDGTGYRVAYAAFGAGRHPLYPQPLRPPGDLLPGPGRECAGTDRDRL
ncbi:MAG: Glyoxalase/bleomycin resistance protein/dioxygenase, partial [Olavius algarvensis Gamma 1 endosymbiont]